MRIETTTDVRNRLLTHLHVFIKRPRCMKSFAAAVTAGLDGAGSMEFWLVLATRGKTNEP